MRTFLAILVLLVIGAGSVSACPMCADAAKNGASADDAKDPMQEVRAYELSIYLMGGMPYLLMTGLGCLFYRAVKKAQRQAELAAQPGPEAG
ncbi:MAG: hypothetical protein AB7K24_12040 [Gemmataceae bacterium]